MFNVCLESNFRLFDKVELCFVTVQTKFKFRL